MKKNTIFKQLAKGCYSIFLCSIAMTFYLHNLINSREFYSKKISEIEVEKFNQWLLSLSNPFIYVSLLFGFLALIFLYFHCKREKENK
ncbi:hypothetical protein M5442_004737 [Salmonella enterica]|uniref:hypothetical protein n=1 Tax=Enterobacterales TaxID=91347 RepID=UPI0012B95E0E|nr:MULTISPECIES: hypothetical protein [Enterobacterales]EAP9755338.1 hypothetical protein [Salmonella enterica]EDN3489062.1 hypothetical protein [Salmonella enterica subsp. enterica serovar Montevideo]EDU5237544.1 hypothetical protein [Salmonella enterica subsp. enterica serovar Braenderup]EGT4477768.1 hypothetical protein [Cronobacter sakazakii]EIW8827769.1 hypothetical protein [Klebsiella pneumoniae]EKZ8367449.1 hypothetical protein [Salmonella enterica subsp. enterica serovar Infantis]ELI